MSIGMPQSLVLDEFGLLVREAFGHIAYHVGSSMGGAKGVQWRDVDVRAMLPDDEYAAMGLGDPAHPHSNAKWCALCLAFSALGQKMTGLPIDFQIQQITAANLEFDKPRSAMGVLAARRHQPEAR